MPIVKILFEFLVEVNAVAMLSAFLSLKGDVMMINNNGEFKLPRNIDKFRM